MVGSREHRSLLRHFVGALTSPGLLPLPNSFSLLSLVHTLHGSSVAELLGVLTSVLASPSSHLSLCMRS
jgi:hypothetical protein